LGQPTNFFFSLQEYVALAAVEACMQAAVPFFKQRGARGVILDVRFNSGGAGSGSPALSLRTAVCTTIYQIH
jgi:C-terminal processing protease CtpA/Prc